MFSIQNSSIVKKKKKISIQMRMITDGSEPQNAGAVAVISQYESVAHVDTKEVLGVVLPKHSAYAVEFMQAYRESELHVPHGVGQSAGIVDGLAQISDVSLHTVSDGQVNVEPVADPLEKSLLIIA